MLLKSLRRTNYASATVKLSVTHVNNTNKLYLGRKNITFIVVVLNLIALVFELLK